MGSHSCCGHGGRCLWVCRSCCYCCQDDSPDLPECHCCRGVRNCRGGCCCRGDRNCRDGCWKDVRSCRVDSRLFRDAHIADANCLHMPDGAGAKLRGDCIPSVRDCTTDTRDVDAIPTTAPTRGRTTKTVPTRGCPTTDYNPSRVGIPSRNSIPGRNSSSGSTMATTDSRRQAMDYSCRQGRCCL